jgi:hypothetical protein
MQEGSSETGAACVVCGAEVQCGVERCLDCGLSKSTEGAWKPLLGIVAAGVGTYLLNRLVRSSNTMSPASSYDKRQVQTLAPGTFAGRWCSTDSLSSISANEFFLQVDIDRNGSFRGTWEPYTFMQVATGAFGMPIAGGYRSNVSSPAFGQFDFTQSAGWIALAQASRQELTIEYQSAREIRLSTTMHGVGGDTERIRSTILR